LAIRLKFLWPAATGTVLLTALCIITAQIMFQQQSTMTGILRENVTSRRAAVDLEECLYDISALLHDNVDEVSALHHRLGQHLGRLREVANQPEEQEASRELDHGLAKYMESWEKIPAADDSQHDVAVRAAIRSLELNLIKPCQKFRLYNGQRIEQSTMQHESVLARLAWGMTGIGILGGVAGLVLGFGLTRALGQSIRRLQVRIRDAAGKLAPELPEIIVTDESNFSQVHAELDHLTRGIERVISDLRQRELEVLRAEQLAAVGHLAASVAHEIRNPLTSIKMLVQSGQEPGIEPGQSSLSKEDLRVIDTEIRRMESSLKTFLDFTRPPKLERRSTVLLTILQEVMGLVRGRAGQQKVEMQLDIDDEQIVVMADAEQLRQVVVNLVLNSLDALPRGGTIVISVATLPDQVQILVQDSGAGIAADMLPRLFQPFSSNKETGLGLGLVISRRIIEDHGGSISAENATTGGAVFCVRMPRN
jgi:two-component system, NtrC family, sensor histidine kinase HydH